MIMFYENFSCPEPFYSMYDPDDLPPLRDWRDGKENDKPGMASMFLY